jgi:hypothetical protein
MPRALKGAIPEDLELDDELHAEALTAGCDPARIDKRFADLKSGPIGGKRGIFARDLRDYIRRQFSNWRMWDETDRAKQLGRVTRAGPEDRLQKQTDRVRMLREQEAEEERRGAAGGVSS